MTVPSYATELGSESPATSTSVCFSAPFEFRKLRLMSTIVAPFQLIFRRGLDVTSATTVASRFSLKACSMRVSLCSGDITTAIRSWDSDIASSVPSSPSYFLGTISRSIVRPSASSPIATDTPPAPKSLQRLMSLETSGFLNRR